MDLSFEREIRSLSEGSRSYGSILLSRTRLERVHTTQTLVRTRVWPRLKRGHSFGRVAAPSLEGCECLALVRVLTGALIRESSMF